MDGMVVKLRNGLKSLKVLNPETLLIAGIKVSKEVTTTIKSSQFQRSLK